MNPGLLDRQITLQTGTPVTQADGSVETTWATHSQPWARVIPVSGGRTADITAAERWNDPQLFIIRYDSTVNVRMRILYGVDLYEIAGLGEEPNTPRLTYLRLIGSRLDPQPAAVTAGPTP